MVQLSGYINGGSDLKPQVVSDVPSPIVDVKFVKNSNGTYRKIFIPA